MKNFKQHQAIQILELTPAVLHTLLGGLDNGWINCKEGENTWISFDVVGHFLHGEQTDYIECLTIILSENTDKNFKPLTALHSLKQAVAKPFCNYSMSLKMQECLF